MRRMFRMPHPTTIILFVLITLTGMAQVQRQSAEGPVLQGTVQSAKVPIPGAVVLVTNLDTQELLSTTTDLEGKYSLRLPALGRYSVSVEMSAFAQESHEVTITDKTQPTKTDFELTLLSRSQRPAAATTGPSAPVTNRRSRVLEPSATRSQEQAEAEQSGSQAGNDELIVPAELALPGMTADAATESVAVSGNTAQPAFSGMFDPRFIDAQQALAGFGPPGGPTGPGDANFGGPQSGPGNLGSPGGPGAGPDAGPGGARGGFGGGQRGGGGFAGRGGGGGGGRGVFTLGGARGRTNTNRPNLNFSYTLGDSAFDAAPYSLQGTPAAKPEYAQNRLTATIGGPLNIPKLISGERNFYTFTYNGALVHNPFDAFSTVPTPAERAGDFSQSFIKKGPTAGTAVTIVDPGSGLPFPNNRIPSINPAAAGLLAFIPEPNQPGDVQNFHYVASTQNNTNDINLRFNHTFSQAGQRGGGQGAGAGRGGFGGGGGRGGGRRGSQLSFGLQLRTQNSTVTNPFPTLGGSNEVRGLNIPINYSRSFGRLTTNLRFNFNRQRTSTTNLYAFKQNVTGNLGITGVSQNPFDWGVPNLSFTNFGSLNDVQPARRVNQTVQVGDQFIWSHGKHNVRWGGDFRWLQLNTQTDSNARGSFTFTGAATGFDFADFLLGLPQLTTVQYGANDYHFRGHSWDLFVQDDWRIRPTVTLNLGLRYEYISPFSETNNHIVNLDASPDFAAVAPALPGATGPFSGKFPSGLMNPDRNNFGPRIGIAWRVMNQTVVRLGYGVNYNNAAYSNIVQQLAFQPPFSVTETNITSPLQVLTLQSGFPTPPPSTLTNNFGVDRNYTIGYVQMWNLDIQRQIGTGLVMNLDYTGTKGTHLDILTAPNRNATGLRITGVQPFSWETSAGNSVMHAGSVQLRRRLQHGFSMGGSYTFSKSIDNASSIGGAGSGVVAQDAFNLALERGLSTFDQTHRFTGTYIWELPFGHEKRWLSGQNLARALLGDWQLSGQWTLASGQPFTARILGDTSDIRRGTNGTLRPDVTGLPIAIDSPTVAEWFNIAAFVLPPPGTFGTAGRDTIRGPGTRQFDMALNKTIPIRDTHVLDFRIQATNVFNTPQFRIIDTTVNSPSFGRVTSVGSMRKLQFVARFRF